MVTRRGKQAIRKADARKYEFLEVPLRRIVCLLFHRQIKTDTKASRRQYQSYGKVNLTKSILI